MVNEGPSDNRIIYDSLLNNEWFLIVDLCKRLPQSCEISHKTAFLIYSNNQSCDSYNDVSF